MQFVGITCVDCGYRAKDGEWMFNCHGASRCASCDAKHRAVTESQRSKQTPFCVSMHFACAADGMAVCPVCEAHISTREEPANA